MAAVPVLIANTMWAPLFVYGYSFPWALGSAAIGFAAEYGMFRLYTRKLLDPKTTLRKLLRANLISYVAGYVLMAFVPLTIHKNNLAETATAFVIAYGFTVAIEWGSLRPLLPGKGLRLLRTVIMANFVSYAFLFLSYVMWFAGIAYYLREFGFL